MRIKISKDFTTTPGARYKIDGPFSGEEFFDTILDKAFQTAIENKEKLNVDLDGTEGYATSFLDEAFGLLALKYGSAQVLANLIIISNDEPDWIDEIKSYINEPR